MLSKSLQCSSGYWREYNYIKKAAITEILRRANENNNVSLLQIMVDFVIEADQFMDISKTCEGVELFLRSRNAIKEILEDTFGIYESMYDDKSYFEDLQ